MNSETTFRLKSVRVIVLMVGVVCIWLFWFNQAHACLFSCNIANDLNTLDQSGAQEQSTTVFPSGNFNVNYCSSGDCNTSFYSNGDGTYSTITTNNNSGGGGSNGSGTSQPQPVVTLRVKNATQYPAAGKGWTANDLKIGQNDEIHLTWASSNVTSCAGTNFGVNGKKSGTKESITEPEMGESLTYKVTCTGSYGTVVDSVKVTTVRPPVTTLFVKNATQRTAEVNGDTTIGANDTIHLRWAATRNPAKCVASASPADSSFSTSNDVEGTDKSVAEPAAGTSRTFTVTCSNRSGSHADSSVVTSMPAPVVTLYVQNVTENSAETDQNISIGSSDTIKLRWAATNNPTTCTPSASPADSTFGTNPDTTVTEPVAGAPRTFSVTCSNRSGSHTDSLVVTATAAPLRSCTLDSVTLVSGRSATFYQATEVPYRSTCTGISRTCTDGTLSGDSTYQYASCVADLTPDTDISIRAIPQVVRYGESSLVEWDGADADYCTVTGGSLNTTGIEGDEEVNDLHAQVTYTLRCMFGSSPVTASTTVKVLPRMQET